MNEDCNKYSPLEAVARRCGYQGPTVPATLFTLNSKRSTLETPAAVTVTANLQILPFRGYTKYMRLEIEPGMEPLR